MNAPNSSPRGSDRDVETGLITHRICEVCGQTIDLSDADQIFHHGPEPHEQLAR